MAEHMMDIPVPVGPLSGPHADTAVIQVPVIYSDQVEYGETQLYPVAILLRTLDERVLLHELFHVLLRCEPGRLVQAGDEQEQLVRYLTRGLLLAGYRRTEDRSDLPCPSLTGQT